MKKQNTTVTRGPGRPQYQMLIPSGKFTFTDLEIANGVNPKTGKGKRCTTLTLRKNLKKDMYILDKKGEIARTNPNSLIVLLKDILAEPDSKSGLGRKQLVYIRRSQLNRAGKSNSNARKSRKQAADVAVNVGVSQATQDYEATKAALLAPDPVPAVTITPAPAVVETATATEAIPVAAPVSVAETPAPEAVVAETAAVAAEATKAVS